MPLYTLLIFSLLYLPCMSMLKHVPLTTSLLFPKPTVPPLRLLMPVAYPSPPQQRQRPTNKAGEEVAANLDNGGTGHAGQRLVVVRMGDAVSRESSM